MLDEPRRLELSLEPLDDYLVIQLQKEETRPRGKGGFRCRE
jgi:hypothetical protein